VLILVHRQELLNQASDKLLELGTEHGLIAAGRSMNADAVQVASVQTLVRRLDRVQKPDLIIVDEGHHALAGTWQTVLKRWPGVMILGVTATPCRMDGKGLGVHAGGFYDKLIYGPSIRWLIDNDFLAQPIVYAPPTPIDMDGIKTVAGDYDKKEVNHRIDKPSITGCAVDHYRRLCNGMPAIAFCASVTHAEHVAEEFKTAGIPSLSIDGTLSPEVRRSRIAGLTNGSIKVLTSCDIISEGTDVPILGAAILLRPTKSTGLYLQQVGRVLRKYEGKGSAVILDHVGNCLRHGLPDDEREWTLDGYRRSGKGKSKEPELSITICKRCFAYFKKTLPACPQCGADVEVEVRKIKHVDGQLQQVTSVHVKAKKKYSNADWAQLRDIMADVESRGMPKAMAYRLFHRLKNKGLAA
jgi:superfamily II DNA or RNA helicase